MTTTVKEKIGGGDYTYNELPAITPGDGWILVNKGDYALLTTNIGCPYENMDKKIRLDAPYEFVLYCMGTARERCFYIPGYGNQYQWDLYRISSENVPYFSYEERQEWLYEGGN